MSEMKAQFSGEAVSLADLAGIDMDQVAEKRQSSLPRGTYVFKVVVDAEGRPPHLEVLGEGEKAKAAAVFPLEVVEVVNIKDTDAEAPDNYLKRTHREALFLGDDEAIGYCKAFLVDIGTKGSGKFQSMLASTLGLKFQATILHRKDRNDADKVYVNLDRNKGKIVALGA